MLTSLRACCWCSACICCAACVCCRLPASPDPYKKLGAVLAIDELVLVKVRERDACGL